MAHKSREFRERIKPPEPVKKVAEMDKEKEEALLKAFVEEGKEPAKDAKAEFVPLPDEKKSPLKERTGGWIETFVGLRFYPMDPRPEEIHIRDIAHSLSLQCRFNGHCSRFYSVAEHCVRAVYELEKINPIFANMKAAQMHVLLHDASEAYICDIPRPFKPELPNYKEIEKKIQDMVYARFNCTSMVIQETLKRLGMALDFNKVVEAIDGTMLSTEARDLYMNKRRDWELPFKPVAESIIPYGPEDAERMFLQCFQRLAN